MIRQTRFKTVLIGLALALIEGLLKSFISSFPIVETFGIQGGIITAYLTIKTVNNVRRIKADEQESC